MPVIVAADGTCDRPAKRASPTSRPRRSASGALLRRPGCTAPVPCRRVRDEEDPPSVGEKDRPPIQSRPPPGSRRGSPARPGAEPDGFRETRGLRAPTSGRAKAPGPCRPPTSGVRAVGGAQVGREDLLLSFEIAPLLVEEELLPVGGEVDGDRAPEPGEVALLGRVRNARKNHPSVVLGQHAGVEEESVARDIVEPGNPRGAPRAARETRSAPLVASPAREENLVSRRAPEDRPRPGPLVGQNSLACRPDPPP